MSRILTWFSTKRGRIFTRSVVGLTAVGVCANQIAINGLLLDKVIEVTQVYRNAEPNPLPPTVNSIIKQVLHDSSLKEEQKEKLKFYYVVGHSLLHFGGIDSPWGAAIGIPFNFEDIKDVNFGQLKLYGKELDWVIDGQDLIKALTLSEDAKKFGLLREIYSCSFSNVLQNAALAALCVLFPAQLSYVTNKRTNALAKVPFKKRLLYYTVYYVFGFILYRCLKDPTKHLAEKKADEQAAKTSPSYLEGGVEFYKKSLDKNKALREVLGKKGAKLFDAHGNENYFILSPKLPLSKRLEYLQKLKKEDLA